MADLREAAQMALDWFEDLDNGKNYSGIIVQIEALRAALAQPEQEPVAMVVSKTGDLSVTMSWWHEPALPVGTPLYTTPPQREWQGLTDDEIGAMEKEYLFGGKEFDDEIGYWAVYRAIEAKLKQKNYQSALHNMNKAAEKNGEEL